MIYHPPPAFYAGRDAALSGENRQSPPGLSEEDRQLWLDGWDSVKEGDRD